MKGKAGRREGNPKRGGGRDGESKELGWICLYLKSVASDKCTYNYRGIYIDMNFQQ